MIKNGINFGKLYSFTIPDDIAEAHTVKGIKNILKPYLNDALRKII